MNIVCAWCGAKIGKKDGRGVSGTSHSMCRECFEKADWPGQGGKEIPNDKDRPANIDIDMDGGLRRALKSRRLAARLTLARLAKSSKVSQSHLARIENGQRFPSATVLGKIAGPLGFDQGEILHMAGYLSDEANNESRLKGLDPVVARTLAQETFETQRAILILLESIKVIARRM
jgi:transcriptional regulator with XRE-family HTH domain